MMPETASKLDSEQYREVQARIGGGAAAGERAAAGAPTLHAVAHRSNAEERQAVLAALKAQPHLSDREIAKLAGVSPQTANNYRSANR